MATQNWFILTSAQRDAAMNLNGEEYQIDPRAVDAASPGSGLNINESAVGVAVGEGVSLTGKYVTPYRVINDPDYVASVPDLVTYLRGLPAALLESETIFAPVSM